MKLAPKKKQVIRGSGGACGRTGRKLSLAPKRKQVVRDEDGEFGRQRGKNLMTPTQVPKISNNKQKTAPEGKKSDDADAGAKNQ